jgi:hypothetical protein
MKASRWKRTQNSSSARPTEKVMATALQYNIGDIHVDFMPSESTVTTRSRSSLLNERMRKSITRKDHGF